MEWERGGQKLAIWQRALERLRKQLQSQIATDDISPEQRSAMLSSLASMKTKIEALEAELGKDKGNER